MQIRRSRLQQHAAILNWALPVIDFACVVGAAYLAAFFSSLFHLRELSSALAMMWPTSYGMVVLVVALLTPALFAQLGLYRAWRGSSVATEIRQLLMAWVLLFLGFSAAMVFTQTALAFPRDWLAAWFALGVVFIGSGRVLLRLGLRTLRGVGFNHKRIIIVGSRDLAQVAIRNLSAAPWAGIDVLGAVDDGLPAGGTLDDGTPVLGNLADLPQLAAEPYVDQIWLALPLSAEDTMEQILQDLRHSTVDVRMVPDLFGFRVLRHSIEQVAGLPVLNLALSPMTGVNRILKAFEDRVIAAIILVLISPLLATIAVAVKLSSPGQVIFKQRRNGWDGKPINVYKFRTMYTHRENGETVTQASRNDARITPIGHFLRRTSLDELPQFFNVLQGKMSIVGPRPHAVAHNEMYKDLVDNYMYRHKVKPGITGWAQINGYRGQTDTLDKMKKRVEYDLYYIEHWSLGFDLKIILLTMVKGFVHKNAY